MIINGENKILGRLATHITQELLQGKTVDIVNAEKIVMTGTLIYQAKKMKQKLDSNIKSNPYKGPKYSRMPDKIIKRAVKGMLPSKSKSTEAAMRRLKVYIGLPEKFEGTEFADVSKAESKATKKVFSIGELSKTLGAKW